MDKGLYRIACKCASDAEFLRTLREIQYEAEIGGRVTPAAARRVFKRAKHDERERERETKYSERRGRYFR